MKFFAFFFYVGLCDDCSYKLNYHQKRKEVTKSKKRKSKNKTKKPKSVEIKREECEETSEENDTESKEENSSQEPSASTDIWRESQQTVEEKSRDEEFDEYLEDLFLWNTSIDANNSTPPLIIVFQTLNFGKSTRLNVHYHPNVA